MLLQVFVLNLLTLQAKLERVTLEHIDTYEVSEFSKFWELFQTLFVRGAYNASDNAPAQTRVLPYKTNC